MENRSSHSYPETREGSGASGQFSSNRVPFYTRQSSRKNYSEKTEPPYGLYKFNHTRATRIPTQPLDLPPTLKNGGNDKVGFQTSRSPLDVRTLAASDPTHGDGTPSGSEVIQLTQRPMTELPLAMRERSNRAQDLTPQNTSRLAATPLDRQSASPRLSLAEGIVS
ncbi:hypothetical protein TNCV_219751 [Trichonephila clavipes]|nr:hypothetical protein TNCV_219751 [Trichonephila clavipes]